MIVDSIPHYWLKNAHIPASFLENPQSLPQTPNHFCLLDLEIKDGIIQQLVPGKTIQDNVPGFDVREGIVLPCFVDSHTHLDKGHIWERSPNPNSNFEQALVISRKDAAQYWQFDDLYRRMEFGLKCSYAHGTRAIRTHIDCGDGQYKISLQVFRQLQRDWQDKIILEAVSLVPLDCFLTEEGVQIADKIAEVGGVLGGVAYINPQLDKQLDAVFTLAQSRGLDLDLHTDENGDADSIGLQKITEAAFRHPFTGQITCDHCCSLAVQSPEQVERTLQQVKAANINIISLPLCNLFLQDRKTGKTPYWRGIPPVQEIQQQGIPVAFASDNCRDPFFGFGDHDMLEVLNQTVRIAQLDQFYGDWWHSVTQTPARIMGLAHQGEIRVGSPADLIIFSGRYESELFARSQHDRQVLRNGQPIDTSLPDYRELDDLMKK
ncbi:cytosine deaminase [Spirulina sp. CS-785/01]|uniref:cytosine deaminase n=1 Tax=Spirulina sp. CS-785/01 TaxID=3021716 RepID=UPI00232D7593|nr:cytosine deaminase [Spirulina sp. CS-785/01]MDB9314425.1 cytosine deaminase [Spirulina sp. CS-785/01]